MDKESDREHSIYVEYNRQRECINFGSITRWCTSFEHDLKVVNKLKFTSEILNSLFIFFYFDYIIIFSIWDKINLEEHFIDLIKLPKQK